MESINSEIALSEFKSESNSDCAEQRTGNVNNAKTPQRTIPFQPRVEPLVRRIELEPVVEMIVFSEPRPINVMNYQQAVK